MNRIHVFWLLLFGLPFEASAGEKPPKNLNEDLPKGALVRMGSHRFRHWGGVKSLVFTPDGKTIVSGGLNSDICIWDATSGKQRNRMTIDKKYPGDKVLSLAPSPDGRTLASGHDGRIVLWDMMTGKEMRRFKGVEGEGFCSVAFSPDGKTLASGGGILLEDDSQVGKFSLWDLKNGKRLRDKRSPHRIDQVVFASAGKMLLVQGPLNVAFWETATFQLRDELLKEGKRNYIRSCALSPDGNRLAVVRDETLAVIDATTRKALFSQKVSILVYLVVFSPNDKLLLTRQPYKDTIIVRNANNEQILRKFGRTGDCESALGFSPDGMILATGCRGGVNDLISLWKVPAFEPAEAVPTHRDSVQSIAFSPDGKLLATGHYREDYEALRLWDASTGKQLGRFSCDQQQIRSLAFLPDGKGLITCGYRRNRKPEERRSFQVWDVTNGKERHRFEDKRHEGGPGIFSPVLDPDGGTLVMWDESDRQKVRVLDATSGKEQRILSLSGGSWKICWNGPLKPYAWTEDDVIHVCSVGAKKDLQTFKTGRSTASQEIMLSPDGKTLCYRDERGHLAWDVKTGKPIKAFTLLPKKTHCWAFSPDARFLAIGAKKEVIVYSSQGKEVARYLGHLADVSCLSFSRDGKRLASGSDDCTAVIWDVARLGRP